CQTESDRDLAFILDASRSVSKNVFDTEKAFLLNTIDSFPSGTTRVAVITYNGTPKVERSWDRLWASESLERVKLRPDNENDRNTSAALDLARQEILSAGRRNALKVHKLQFYG
ncbi:hypothetical protein BaRGS_00039426, partial [Batillaria attramentaria]